MLLTLLKEKDFNSIYINNNHNNNSNSNNNNFHLRTNSDSFIKWDKCSSNSDFTFSMKLCLSCL